MTKRLLILVGIVLVFFVYFLLSPKNNYQVKKGNIDSMLTASGKIDADKKVGLSFKTTARVASVEVNEGDFVKKDAILARLDTRELNLSLARSIDDLRQAEAELAKTYDDVKGHKNDETYTQIQTRTQAEVKRDKAIKTVESAKKSLVDTALYAPFSGLVIKRNLEVNEWVSAFSFEPQIVLIDPTTVYFSAEIDEENIGIVKIGQTAWISFDAYPDKKFIGEVYQIAQTTTQIEGGNIVKVKVKLNDFSDRIIIGMSGDAEIILLQKDNVLLIPKDVIYKKNGDDFVKTSSGEKRVKLGIFDGQFWEVLEGLSDGDKIKW